MRTPSRRPRVRKDVPPPGFLDLFFPLRLDSLRTRPRKMPSFFFLALVPDDPPQIPVIWPGLELLWTVPSSAVDSHLLSLMLLFRGCLHFCTLPPPAFSIDSDLPPL